ncbi:hypothetical protein HDV00_006645 [Rhizophlyctis rosea]|nr:hypothetical protein HDV00_006645 [Rhizophlyctis rosea]
MVVVTSFKKPTHLDIPTAHSTPDANATPRNYAVHYVLRRRALDVAFMTGPFGWFVAPTAHHYELLWWIQELSDRRDSAFYSPTSSSSSQSASFPPPIHPLQAGILSFEPLPQTKWYHWLLGCEGEYHTLDITSHFHAHNSEPLFPHSPKYPYKYLHITTHDLVSTREVDLLIERASRLNLRRHGAAVLYKLFRNNCWHEAIRFMERSFVGGSEQKFRTLTVYRVVKRGEWTMGWEEYCRDPFPHLKSL